MLSAQATWDATMGYYAVQALKQSGDPKAIMVILVGSGHVAYGVGIERQAKKWVDGPIASVIPVSVGSASRGIEKDTQASYANFTWGVADEADTAYPTMGTSTAVGAGRGGAPGDHRAGGFGRRQGGRQGRRHPAVARRRDARPTRRRSTA